MKIIDNIIEEINLSGYKFNINEFEVYYQNSFDLYYLNILNDDFIYDSDFEYFINEFYIKFQIGFNDASVFITSKKLGFDVKGNLEKKYVLDSISKAYVEDVLFDNEIDFLKKPRRLNTKDVNVSDNERVDLEIKDSKTYTLLTLKSQFERNDIYLNNNNYLFDIEIKSNSNPKLNEVA